MSKIFGVETNEDANSHLKKLNFNFSYSKPESLLDFFIRIITREIDIILDFFMGFRVIIMTQANSQVNTIVLELLPKFKIKKRIVGVLFGAFITKINVVNSTSA